MRLFVSCGGVASGCSAAIQAAIVRQAVAVQVSSISRVGVMETVRVIVVGGGTIDVGIGVGDVIIVMLLLVRGVLVEPWVEIVVVDAVGDWVVVAKLDGFSCALVVILVDVAVNTWVLEDMVPWVGNEVFELSALSNCDKH